MLGASVDEWKEEMDLCFNTKDQSTINSIIGEGMVYIEDSNLSSDLYNYFSKGLEHDVMVADLISTANWMIKVVDKVLPLVDSWKGMGNLLSEHDIKIPERFSLELLMLGLRNN